MSNYIVSTSQILAFAVSTAAVAFAAAFVGTLIINYYNLPEVHLDKDGKCVRVVNYKNGEGFTCQDRDVVLRKYRLSAKP